MTDIQAKLEKYRKQKEKEKLRTVHAVLPLTARYLPTILTAWLGTRNSLANDSKTSNNEEPVLTPVPPLEAQENFLNEKKLKSELRKRGKTALNYPVKHDIPEPEPYIEEQTELSNEWTKLDWLILALKLMLWFVLLKIFLHLEFAAVFVAVSMFYLMWTNFRKDRRKPWEPSAYSVFNPNCEAIEGTLKPEQFEREIRYGGL